MTPLEILARRNLERRLNRARMDDSIASAEPNKPSGTDENGLLTGRIVRPRQPSIAESEESPRESDRSALASKQAGEGRDQPPPNKLVSDFDRIWTIATGAPPAPWIRKFWQAKIGIDSPPPMVAQRVFDHHEADSDQIWEQLGVRSLLKTEPAEWLGLDPLVFIVGCFERFNGALPSVHWVMSVLEMVLEVPVTPRDLVAALASEKGSPAELVKQLDPAITATRSEGRWFQNIIAREDRIFDRGRIMQSVMILRMAWNLGRMHWGAAPLTWAYNGLCAAERMSNAPVR